MELHLVVACNRPVFYNFYGANAPVPIEHMMQRHENGSFFARPGYRARTGYRGGRDKRWVLAAVPRSADDWKELLKQKTCIYLVPDLDKTDSCQDKRSEDVNDD